jgi:hypothetical protein
VQLAEPEAPGAGAAPPPQRAARQATA